jgi:hypothetical protein
MSVRSAQSITTIFTTRVFSTGVGTNADSLPTGTLYVNGTADAASVTVTNISTGLYKAQVTLPTLALNDVVSLVIAATVSSVADKAKIWEDTKDFFAGSIPDAAAGGTNGLFIAGSNAATTVNITGNITGTVSTVTTVTNQLTAAQIATGVWQDTTSGDFTVSSSIGKSLYTSGNAPGAASGIALVGSNMGTVTSVTGSVGSVTGAVGSVTGAVGSVTGSVGSVTGAVGSVTTVTSIVNGVWDEAISGHLTGGTTGAKLNAAASAGDPWSTVIPGAYGAGTAGHRLGNVPDLVAGASGGLFIAGSNATTNVNFTGNLSGSVGSVTGNVGGSVASVTAAVTADMTKINGDATAASNLQKSASVIYQGSVTGAATTTTLVDSGLTQADTDHWKGRILLFTSGNLKFQGTDITSFNAGAHQLGFTALTNAPSGGDSYVIV